MSKQNYCQLFNDITLELLLFKCQIIAQSFAHTHHNTKHKVFNLKLLPCFHINIVLTFIGSEFKEKKSIIPARIPIHQEYAFMILVIYCHQWILQELVNLILLAGTLRTNSPAWPDWLSLTAWLAPRNTDGVAQSPAIQTSKSGYTLRL